MFIVSLVVTVSSLISRDIITTSLHEKNFHAVESDPNERRI